MKAEVDRDKCVGSAQCTGTCPEVFELRDGKSHVYADPVPENVEDKCRKAAEGCPVNAITIQE